MKDLKEHEHKLLCFLNDQRNWRAPAFSSMAKCLKKDSAGGFVTYTLKALIEKGYIDKNYKPLTHSEDNVS